MLYFIFLMAGGVAFGIFVALYLNTKTGYMKPRVKGQKKEYYTVGQLIKLKIKRWRK